MLVKSSLYPTARPSPLSTLGVKIPPFSGSTSVKRQSSRQKREEVL